MRTINYKKKNNSEFRRRWGNDNSEFGGMGTVPGIHNFGGVVQNS